MQKTVFQMILFIFLIISSSSCNNKEQNDYQPKYSNKQPASDTTYIFGVHPLHNPKRLFRVYQPLVEFINRHLKGARLKLEASRNYAAYDKKLFSGHFHFSLPNPYQTVTASEKGYNIFGKMGDDHNFRGIILIRKDSGIKKISDLKGKTVSYPAPTALAATMMPQWYMYVHGININKDIKNFYVGSQESSIMNVFLGKTAAAATWPPPWKAFIKERPDVGKAVIVKWRTPPLPNNGLVARKDVPPDLLKKISQLFFALHTHAEGRKILQAMELSRFESANKETYRPVVSFLNKFKLKIRKIRLLP